MSKEMTKQLLFLELNEINFEDVEFYCEQGLLPTFSDLFARHGWARTTSENSDREIEPWIQWVTAHTGLSSAEHGVFRLGDVIKYRLRQIWEELEDRGLSVGAISPMNAKNQLKNAAFFVPDPWTETEISAGRRLRWLYAAIAQAVNDNARARLTIRSAGQLALGLLSFARRETFSTYIRLAGTALRASWRRAIFLDVLLSDTFICEIARASPNFATLFLNAGAHIQHHFMFSAACYGGRHRNPDWYVRPGVDPVLEVYRAYDNMIAAVRKAFPRARLMIATGLHQVPHGGVTYYWRLRDHRKFLKRIQVPFAVVQTRMSRDFLLVCESAGQATVAEQRLAAAVSADGIPLFEVDNRGSDLFVVLAYPGEIDSGFTFFIGASRYTMSKDDVSFVALKNGEHSGIGYFADSGRRFGRGEETFPLKDIPRLVKAAFEIGTDSNDTRSSDGAVRALSVQIS